MPLDSLDRTIPVGGLFFHELLREEDAAFVESTWILWSS